MKTLAKIDYITSRNESRITLKNDWYGIVDLLTDISFYGDFKEGQTIEVEVAGGRKRPYFISVKESK